MASAACASPSQPAEEPRPEHTKVSLQFERVPLKTAFRRFFQGEGLPRETFTPNFPPQYAIDPNVPDPPITLHIRGISWINALPLLVGAAWEKDAHVVYSREGNIYIVKLRWTRDGQDSPAEYVRKARREIVSVAAERRPLAEAVRETFTSRKARVRVDADVAAIPVSLQAANITAEEAVTHLARAADREMPGVTYTRAGHYFVIHRAGAPSGGGIGCITASRVHGPPGDGRL